MLPPTTDCSESLLPGMLTGSSSLISSTFYESLSSSYLTGDSFLFAGISCLASEFI